MSSLIPAMTAGAPLQSTNAATASDVLATEHARSEQRLRGELKRHPGNEELTFKLAQVLSWQGNHLEAEDLYRRLLAVHPDNGDYQLGMAQTLAWSGRPQQAIPVLERLTDGGRNNPDALRLLIQSLAAGTSEQRQRANRLRIEARRHFPGQDFGKAATAAAPVPAPVAEADMPLPNQLEIGGGHDVLSNGRAPWNSQYLLFSKQFAPRTSWYGGVQRTERFDLEDVQLHLGGYLPLAERWTANLEAGYSPTGRVLPQHYEQFELQRKFDGGLLLGAGYRFREYADAQTHGTFFTAEKYFSDFRLAYTYSPSFVRNQTAHTHRVQLGYWYSDYNFVNLSYGIGNEINNIVPVGVVSSQVESFGINGRHWINRNWAITWSFSHLRQGNYYDRTGGQIGIRMAF